MNIIEKIIDSSYSLFIRFGVKSVSMDDIARKIGVSKKTIYNLIENKKDLVKKVVERYLVKETQDIKAIVSGSTDALDEMLKIAKHVIELLRGMTPSLIYDLQKYHPSVWQLIETEHYGFIKTVIEKNINRGQKEGIYRPEINPEIIATLYVVKSRSISDPEIFSKEQYSQSNLAEAVIDYHICGLVNEKGHELLKKQKTQ